MPDTDSSDAIRRGGEAAGYPGLALNDSMLFEAEAEKTPSHCAKGQNFSQISPRQALCLRLTAPAVFGNIRGDYTTIHSICQSLSDYASFVTLIFTPGPIEEATVQLLIY